MKKQTLTVLYMPNESRNLFVVPQTVDFTSKSYGTRVTTPQIRTERTMPNIDIVGTGQKMNQYYQSLPQDVRDHIQNNVKEKVASAVNNRMQNPSATAPPVGGGGIGTGSRRHSSGYSLSKAPNPKQVSLDTGIVPNTYTSDYMQAIENACSPLHMTGAYFTFPNYSASALQSYFLNITAFDLQTRAQANVGFNINVNTDFTAANILTAFNALVSALQIYFYYMSIISYHSDPTNKNEGMIYLRQQFTPAIIESLTILGRRLADTPCPPKLFEFLRYLMGNFYSGPTAGSPIIKICPFATSSTCIDATQITTALTNLNTTTNNQIFTILRRSVPQWSPKVLYDVEPIPLYDDNFKTIFANLPFAWYNGSVKANAPAITNESDTIAYNTFTETLDGAAYAMTSVWQSSSSARLPGLMSHASTNNLNGDTRVSYYSVSNVAAFYSSNGNSFLTRSRQETYQMLDNLTGLVAVHLSGADKCSAVSALTIKETCLNVIDYLMSADTMKVDPRKFLSGESTPPKSFKKSRRR